MRELTVIRVEFFMLLIKRVFFFFDWLICSVLSMFYRNNNVDIVFLQNQSNYGYIYEGKSYPHLTGSLFFLFNKENINANVVFLNKPFSSFKKEDTYYKSDSTNMYFIFESLTNYVLVRLLKKRRAKEIRESRRYYIWDYIISRYSPKVIIAIQPEPQLCAVSKTRHIEIYDLQHGVISKSHRWYGNELPNNYSKDQLPTGILFWDIVSAKNIRFWTIDKGVESYIIGNPWVNRFLEKRADDFLVHDAMNNISFLNDRPVILVSLQWGLENLYYKDNDNFDTLMCKALEETIMKTSNKYQWLLRLHPVQMQKKLKENTLEYLNEKFGKLENVEWDRSSNMPLPIILSKTDLHITDMSTVVVEASIFGIASAILNPYLKSGEVLEDLFVYERSIGAASIINQNSVDIVAWIERNIRLKGEFSVNLNNKITNFNDFISDKLKK